MYTTTSTRQLFSPSMVLWSISLSVKRQYQGLLFLILLKLILSMPCRNPSQSCTRARTDSGTTNLLRHADTCSGKKAPDNQTITKFAQGSTYSTGAFRFLITRWITECHWPFKIIEDPPFQEMLKMLYGRVEIPSDTTISRDVREVHRISKEQVAKVLQVSIYTSLLYRYLQCHIRNMSGDSTSVLMDGHHQI